MSRIRLSGLLFAGMMCLMLVATVARADEEDMATLERYVPQGPHRLDLSYTKLNTVVGDLDVLLIGYTGTAIANMRFGITSGFATFESPAGSEPRIEETGLADTLVTIQYDPNDRLTASPWVPDTAGLNASLIMPTGDADDGLGGDAWLGSIGAGSIVDFVSHFWLVPAVGYELSFGEGDLAVPINRVYVECAVIWLFPFGGWVGYAPTIAREFETDEWTDAHVLTIGKMWQSGFGMGLDLGKNDRTGRVPTRDDKSWLVNAYYQF
jgi:hypothetical protein